MSTPTSPLGATKRKLDDAFQSLDNAVTQHSPDRPPPTKRSHTVRSLYSTLAKYGIRSKDRPAASVSTSKPTPHLSAILARAARSAFQPSAPTPSTEGAEYRPSSIPSFLARLATYKLATYANKPPAIDAVAAAKCGWVNDGKDRLVCGLCGNSWVVGGRTGMGRDAANALIEKQRTSLVEMHKRGCPWREKQCDPSIYRIPLQAPSAMVRDIKTNALALDPVLQSIAVCHPLTATQLTSIRATVADIAPAESTPSDTALLASLFGWSLAPPAPSDLPPRRTSLSLSRAQSASASRAATPARELPSSPSPMPQTPTPARRTPRPSSALSAPFTFRFPPGKLDRDSSLLHCNLCQRRVGIWAFAPVPEPPTTPQRTPTRGETDTDIQMGDSSSEAPTPEVSTPQPQPPPTQTPKKSAPPQRQFDLLKEHRSYCPYVVRSTVVASLPVPAPPPGTPRKSTSSATLALNTPSKTPPSHMRSASVGQLSVQGAGGAVEGWRAVVMVVLRFGVGRRRGLGGLEAPGEADGAEGGEEEEREEDGVKAMIAGVKSRGGRDLLRYVKGLLG